MSVIQSQTRYALLSATDKTGLIDLAQHLIEQNIALIATDGTATFLKNHDLPVISVSQHTQFPELIGGRVKSLHPKIHAGILAKAVKSDLDELQQHSIPLIDYVIVNLYPFSDTIKQKNCNLDQAVEQIDIGGSTLLRAAAKNHKRVTVIVDPTDYLDISREIKDSKIPCITTRKQLAGKAFSHAAEYDTCIADYFKHMQAPPTLSFPTPSTTSTELRYGENPHQAAAFFPHKERTSGDLIGAKQLQGKALSYNNLLDADAALRCAQCFDTQDNACIIVKHATPCGAALGATLAEAYTRALTTDPQSAFGGIIAVNKAIDAECAERMISSKQFVEVIVAPDISEEAQNILAQKTNMRLLITGHKDSTLETQPIVHSVSGGILLQMPDTSKTSMDTWTIASEIQPTAAQQQDLLFAWHTVSFAKSNAIVYAKDTMALGIGTGQTSRIFSAKIAALKAQESNLSLSGCVMASDGFFPFADSIEYAASIGVSAIIQPGGSKRDNEVIAAANYAGIALIHTHTRHFRH